MMLVTKRSVILLGAVKPRGGVALEGLEGSALEG
jgi:hypothetical protein